MKLFSSNRFVNAALVVALTTVFLMFAFMFNQSEKIKRSARWLNHTEQVVKQIQKITITAMDMQAGARGYVMTGNNTYTTQFSNAKQRLPLLLVTLRSLVADNPAQLPLYDTFCVYLAKRVEISEKMISLRLQNNIAAANDIVSSGVEKNFTDKIRVTGAAMEEIENSLWKKRRKANDSSIRNLNNFFYCLLVVVLLFSFLLFYRVTSSFESQKRSEEKFRALLDAAPDAMVIADRNGEIVMINRQTIQMFGYDTVELSGKPVEILMPEGIRLKHIESRNKFNAAPGNRSMREGAEMIALRKDGSEFPVEICLSPIKTNEGILISASIRDITQRKTSQQQLEILTQQVNGSNDAIFTVDKDLVITNWNYGAEKMYGFTKEEVIGRKSTDMLKMEIADAEQERIRQTVIKEGYWTGEVKRYGKNDIEVYVISSITAIKNKEGFITGYISVSYDIGKQKKLQEELAHLASIVEHSSEAIISRGADRRIVSWNEGAEKMFGYTKKEAAGLTALELGIIRFTPEELKAVDIELAVKGSLKAEKKYYRRNGEMFTGEVSANAIKNSDGDTTAEFFIIQDVSLRKHMEEYLKNSNDKLEEKVRERTEELCKAQNRFRAMIENSDDLITVMDENKKIIYRSPAAERLTGRNNTEIYDIDTFKDLFLPDDFAMMQGHIREATANPGKPVYAPFRIVKKDGGFIFMEGTVTDFLHDENIKAIVFNARDITERKKAEEKLMASERRYREALDNMMEGIQILDKDLRYLYVNDAVAKQAGQPKEELMGKLVTELYPGVEQTTLFKNIQYCLRDSVSLQLQDKFVFPDNTIKYFQLSLQPAPEGVFILSVDITDKKTAEDELMTTLHEKELLADKFSIILNTLPANIALLDNNGVIVDVNDAWKMFAGDNGSEAGYGIGDNYLETSETNFAAGQEQGREVAQGIRAVLNREKNEFEFEYPFHSVTEERWFRMIVSPLKQKGYNGVVIMHINITELKRLENERLKVKVEEQRNITRAMLEGQEKERNQIGRDLHDNIVQLMAATKMKLGLFVSQQPGEVPVLAQSITHIQEALTEARNLSHQMVMPRFTSNIFKDELERLFLDYSNDRRAVNIEFPDIEEGKIAVPLKEALYRIAQEQLHNIEKYAHASCINVLLQSKDGVISMIISDNGIGFNTKQSSKGIGLTNIFNRVESYSGCADIISSPGHGCRLLVKLPLLSTV